MGSSEKKGWHNTTTPGPPEMNTTTLQCVDFTSCSDCLSTFTCVWCPTLSNSAVNGTVGACRDGVLFGASNATCPDWRYGPGFCNVKGDIVVTLRCAVLRCSRHTVRRKRRGRSLDPPTARCSLCSCCPALCGIGLLVLLYLSTLLCK